MSRSLSKALTHAAPAEGQSDHATLVESLEQQLAALEDENRELRGVAQYRSLFLARLAHELRTPLTSILGFAEILLSQEKLTETQQGFCERIQNSAQQLQSNLNQLADLSRLEAGQAELFLEEFSLADALGESCQAVQRQAQKQNATVGWQAANDLPRMISDRGKLRQVLYNFLAYAISRSPDGATVKASVEKVDRGFAVRIEDDGESLPEPAAVVESIELDSASQRARGSELGLAIARRLVDLLDATLSVRNRSPRGLEVIIQLPVGPPELKPR